MDLAELTVRQRVSLWLDGGAGLDSVPDALTFVRDVAVALRYSAAADLPLASMYRATQQQVPVPEDERAAHSRAFELTNGLLASNKVVEINLLAGRLALGHERIMPAIYTLRRGQTGPRLSETARQAFEFIQANEGAGSGDIRRLLNIDRQRRPDAADAALAELQRELLVDRGPSGPPSQGVFYLTREGYPYRVFASAHPDIVSAARQLTLSEAAVDVLRQYLRAALFAHRRKLVSMLRELMSADEVDRAIRHLASEGIVAIDHSGKSEVIVYRA
ncbi:MAG: hypothetical protein JO057_12010 [Chloroflexi bacterium]|nr:hypothetical protein [Chloroflexota bacterium]